MLKTTPKKSTTSKLKSKPINTTAKRYKKNAKKPKAKKHTINPVDPDLLFGNRKIKRRELTAAPRPLSREVPATMNHMPAEHPGYVFRHRLNEFTVDSLSGTHQRFCELPDGSGSRYSMIAYQRTKPFVLPAQIRQPSKKIANELRAIGRIPASFQHVQNGKDQEIYFSIDPIAVEKYKTMKAAWAVEWHIDIDGFQETFRGHIRDWQIDPVTRTTGSIRFVGNSSYTPMKVHIPMEFEGHEDGDASKKGAMMLTPHTNIQAIFDPTAARRLGCGTAPIEIIQITHDRQPHHTVRAGDISLPKWLHIPEHETWSKHVLMTFTKDGK